MSGDLHTRVERIKAKALLISERCRRLTDEINDTREQLARLEEELHRRDRKIEELESRLRFLSIADHLDAVTGNRDATLTFLENMVREIDKCIADLSD